MSLFVGLGEKWGVDDFRCSYCKAAVNRPVKPLPLVGHTMFERFKPTSAEPDVIVQIHWSDIGGDCLDLFYEACVSAACRFVAAFNASHTDAIATMFADTAALLLPRLPCERNWVIS
ncbi:hypothetical protein ACFVJ5_30765 [Nocardia sp. NPDC127606]|uniref:hypothetical protein n=1 Tax=Nocardia sp. NPDC127606 TaxID=3345406 RepID=UPI003641AAC4